MSPFTSVDVSQPPLEPCSFADIASFAGLERALRSHLETSLSKKKGSSLDAECLAKLVESFRHFQKCHLGKVCMYASHIGLTIYLFMYLFLSFTLLI